MSQPVSFFFMGCLFLSPLCTERVGTVTHITVFFPFLSFLEGPIPIRIGVEMLTQISTLSVIETPEL